MMISVRKWNAPRIAAFAALLAALLLASPRAEAAFNTTFSVNGGSLNRLAFAGALGEIGPATWDVFVDGTALTFTNVFLPQVEPGGEMFSLTLPGNSFTATFNPLDGSIVSEAIGLVIDNLESALVGTHTMVLTTGTQTRGGSCNGTLDGPDSGTPLTGTSAKLIVNDCVRGLGSDLTFQQLFRMQVSGVFAEAPTGVPEPTVLALLTLGAAGLLVRRRAA